jgi:hypothetical protein
LRRLSSRRHCRGTSRADLAALRTELQTRYHRIVENQRGRDEQIGEQRADMKVIRTTLERLELRYYSASRFDSLRIDLAEEASGGSARRPSSNNA